MRRISLALALLGAVAAGCSGGSTSDQAGARGIAEGTFTITIQNGQDGNSSLAIAGGYITSSPTGIDCGVAPHSVCSFDFPSNATVTLTAFTNTGFSFWGWAGDCAAGGNVCTIAGETADQYVLARFGAVGTLPPGGHANWDPAIDTTVEHATQARAILATVPLTATAWPCAACHGNSLTGMGIAPSCADCHAGSATPPTPVDPAAPDALAAGETCADCHDGQGAAHQAKYNTYTDASDLTLTINSVASTPDLDSGGSPDGTYTATMTVTITKDGAPRTGIIEADGQGFTSALPQKTFYATTFNGPDGTAGDFNTTVNFNANTARATATAGQYTLTATSKTNGATGSNVTSPLDFVIETGPAIAFGYVADEPMPFEAFTVYNNVAHDGLELGTVNYTSAANDAACQKCHGTPYRKHGYRVAATPDLDEFAACKTCHYDTRNGSHRDWACLATDPAAYAAGTCTTLPTYGQTAYKASVMQDTHQSHAMEFAYPQDMANCVTCHAGKLDITTTDANFTLATCKSCHPITATHPDAKRAPPLNPAADPGVVDPGILPAHHTIDLATGLVGGHACNDCHADNVESIELDAGFNTVITLCDPAAPCFDDGVGPMDPFDHVGPLALFKDIHGYNKVIYADVGGTLTKYSDAFDVAITAATYDSATKQLTFTVTATEPTDVPDLAVTDIVPTVLVSMYGYDTKDFIVGAHVSHTDGARNLEWLTSAVAGTCNCDTDGDHVVGDGCPGGTVPQEGTAADGVCPTYARMELVAPAAGGVWQVRADLGEAIAKSDLTADTLIDQGAITRVEIGVMPTLLNAHHETLALDAVTRTFDLTANAFADGVYPAIVDPNKCNACHEALATTFHSADRGGSVVNCRLCHTTLSGGSHLPMQSRSIDSYVHAIHSMQPFDPGDIDFSDPVEALHYEHHIESTYPNFTTLNCESCHNPGMYNIPDQSRSLPGLLSANDPGMPFVVPSVVTGPGSRACGGCHRAALINEGDVTGLGQFDAHTQAFGYRGTASSGTARTNLLYQIIDALFCDDTETCTAPPPP